MVFHMFKKVEERLNRGMENIFKKIQIQLLQMKTMSEILKKYGGYDYSIVVIAEEKINELDDGDKNIPK